MSNISDYVGATLCGVQLIGFANLLREILKLPIYLKRAFFLLRIRMDDMPVLPSFTLFPTRRSSSVATRAHEYSMELVTYLQLLLLSALQLGDLLN